MAPGTVQAVAVEQTAYRLPAQLNALPLCQDLGQIPVVEADVFLAGQDDRGGSDILGDRVAGLAAPVAVDQCGGPIPPVGRQDSPDLAFADPQNFGRLSLGKLIFHHAVEHLESCLFSLVQCHVLHRRTFSLRNSCGRYRRAMTSLTILTMVDNFTLESLNIYGGRHRRTATDVATWWPKTTRVDSAPECSSKRLEQWAYLNEWSWTSAGPGSPRTVPSSRHSMADSGRSV